MSKRAHWYITLVKLQTNGVAHLVVQAEAFLCVQGGTSFVDLICFSVLCLLCLCVRLFICDLWSPAGKGLTSWFECGV